MTERTSREPLYITLHERDNVAIVANAGGLPAGTVFPSGLKLVEKVPQGHKVAQAMISEMAWYDGYFSRGRVDRSAHTTPGNKKGGLSNIVEKAMGSIIKSGTAPNF